jgi:hypothetical protein
MKTMICICGIALVAGCAHDPDEYYRGSAASQTGFETGPRMDEDAYRSDSSPRSTDRQMPRRSGPGGLGHAE